MIIKEFTVNVGEYDKPRYDIEVISTVNYEGSNQRKSRFPKILAHKFFDCDVSVYWDCNIHLKEGLEIDKVVNEYLQDYDIVAQKCSVGKDCVYQEIEAAKKRVSTYQELEKLTEQANYYRSIGFPEHCGTLAGYQPLIRRHSPIVKQFNEAWWAEIERFSYRDQCSFPVVLSRFPELKVNWVTNIGELTTRKYRHHVKSLV
jgi:hypothetical protein